MDAEKINELLLRHRKGDASAKEIDEIESLIEQGIVQLEDIEDYKKIEDQILKIESPTPSLTLDDRFHHMLRMEKEALQKNTWRELFRWPEFAPRLAFASVTLLLGLVIGYLLRSPEKKDEQIASLGQEISSLKEMMMLSLLEKESATERLKAVSLTQDMNEVSKKVTTALLRTLNNDENVSVRLAALDALRLYVKDSQVREELIRSIAQQKSPLVQVALAELMAQLQEKDALRELQKIVEDGETPADIKQKIQESMRVI